MFMIDLGAQSYYSALGISPNASVKEIQVVCDRIGKELLEKRRSASVEEQEKIDERLKYINSTVGETLRRPEKRKEYDRANAHLRFFTVQVAATPMFVDKVERLHVMHRIIKDFLADKGVVLSPLSDVEREDFSTDVTDVELLDSLLWENP
jgi:curved DNA-binding protein CbpA